MRTRPERETPVMTSWELIALLRKGGGRVEAGVRVLCDRIGALAFRDLIEFYLYWGRTGEWSFVDNTNATNPRQSLIRVIWNLVRDATVWPALYLRHLFAAESLARKSSHMVERQDGVGILYLRTDHIFDQRYGGSVTHTAGVINGLGKAHVPVNVVRTDHVSTASVETGFDENAYEIALESARIILEETAPPIDAGGKTLSGGS